MNPQASGVVTGEAEKTAPEQQTKSLSEEILALMKGEEPEVEETPTEVPEEVPTPPAEQEIPQQTEETQTEEEPAAAPAADEEKKWPQSASKRVAEESDKKRRQQARADKAESERDHWQSRAEQLERQLQEVSGPRPSSKDPLADVFDLPGLNKAKAHYENIRDVVTAVLDENPTQDEIEVVVGKNKDGEPITEMMTRKTLSKMRRDAEHALSDLIPQRKDVLKARAEADTLAFKVYPQFAENDGDNAWTGFVRDTLSDFPDLAKVPDIAIWLGHALIGRRVTLERLQKEIGKGKNGENDTPSTAKEIISAASRKFKAAPPVSTGRVPSQSTPRRGADVETAKKNMKAKPGDDDAMEAFIDAKLFRTPRRGYDAVS